MNPVPVLLTARLRLDRWRPADRAAFAAMNADPAVMAHFPAPLSREDSDALLERIEQRWREDGLGLWAVRRRGCDDLAGFAGLARAGFAAPFTPAVEVGWRLRRDLWGRGYATEAGHAALRYGFETLGLAEVVSFTATGNHRSRAVMDRLGMRRDPGGDFEHPALPVGHPLRPHVLYRLTRRCWRCQVNDSPAEVLRRWEDSGAHWRVVARPPGRVVVSLTTCDGGEEVQRLDSDDPALAGYVGDRGSSQDPPPPA